MLYVSTRGRAPALGFSDVLLAGLASDGGLYVPQEWPQLSAAELSAMAGRPYAEVAFTVLAPFVGGDIAEADLRRMCREAYAGFRHPAVAPLRQLGPGEWVLELFHGPTLAFKDVAMQLLARLMDHLLAERGERVTIIGATSGDTGAAAVEAYAGRRNAELFMFFPKGRVSPIQQRQMTTADAANVHVIAVDGTFDDCQTMVKEMFGSDRLRRRLALSGVNSINWARVVAQVVYYATSAVALGAPDRAVAFTVPTGNFGDIFAGYVALRMGVPIGKLVIATNLNDILARTLATGIYETRQVQATASPSMDIQISSNFERLLFAALDKDAAEVHRLMADLAADGRFSLDGPALAAIRADFAAGTADEAETRRTIAAIERETGFLPDPHTAVGLAVARRFTEPGLPMITLATAHPAKFPDAVQDACGRRPQLPEGYEALLSKPERYAELPNDRRAVESLLLEQARGVRDEV